MIMVFAKMAKVSNLLDNLNERGLSDQIDNLMFKMAESNKLLETDNVEQIDGLENTLAKLRELK